uniref:H0811D08.7 protein n=1 Tax=Oryza sativa TaxID=4530 RepID=Q25AP2_ORYSA|nr:H0811D08.7 [Oryza sativa]
MGIGASGGRGDEIRGRGRMGWIRMLTGERMRREQEDAGATSASRMEIGASGRGDGTDWGGGGHSPMGGKKGVGWRGKARQRRPPADVAPNDWKRSRHGLAHVRGVARVPTTTAIVFTGTREGWGFRLITLAKLLSRASASSRWPAPIPQAHSRPHRAAQKPMCSGVPELRLSFAEANARLRRIVFEVNSIYSMLRSHRPRCMRPFPQRLPLPSFLFAASLLPTHRQVYYLARKELATKRELFDSPFTRLPRLSLDRTSRNPKRKELNWLARKEWIATLGELMVLD